MCICCSYSVFRYVIASYEVLSCVFLMVFFFLYPLILSSGDC
jgi:hypothetical protein